MDDLATQSPSATIIGIAVVEHAGRFLVGTRGPEVPLAGLAEFPGGKCSPDESPAQCAVRECREETGLHVTPVRLLLRRTFDYPHGTVDLHFWLCRLEAPQTAAAVHESFRWVSMTDLGTLDFPEANRPLIEQLSTEFRPPAADCQ